MTNKKNVAGIEAANPASSSPRPDAKTISTLAAKFAIAGRELHVIRKGGRQFYEARRWGECYVCSTEADLHGLLRQFEAIAA